MSGKTSEKTDKVCCGVFFSSNNGFVKFEKIKGHFHSYFCVCVCAIVLMCEVRNALMGRLVREANCPIASRKTVHFDMFGQMVTAGKLLFTHWTLEGLDPRMGPPVSR